MTRRPHSKDYFEFFQHHFPTAKRDLLSDQLMVQIGGIWTPVQSRIEVLNSHALDTGFLKKADIRDHLARYSDQLEPSLLVEFSEWDGRDRIQEIANSVRLKNCSKNVFEDLLKDWGTKLVRRLKDPHCQNRILVFKGAQGIGKDHLIRAIVSGLGQFATNLTLGRDEKDMMMSLSDNIVLIISEFDRTARTEVSTLKDLITRDHSYVRRAYDRGAVRRNIRCSFIASVNVDEILRDHTGNRRFIIFDIEGIDWSYPSNDGQQILAQFKYLADNDFKASDSSEASMKAFIDSQTPEDPKILILEAFDGRLANFEYGNPSKRGQFQLHDIEQMLAELAKNFSMSVKNLQALLKANGRSHRTNVGVLYHREKGAELPPIANTVSFEDYNITRIGTNNTG